MFRWRGTSLANGVALYRSLIEQTQRRIAANESSFPKLANGNVDMNHPLTALVYLRGCYLKVSDIEARFGPGIRPVLDRLTFDPAAFDVSELRYQGVTRTPLFRWSDNERLVIGELVSDSLFTNTHYSLLENAGTIVSGKTSVAQEYKHRYAERFLDGLAEAAAVSGYREVSRGIDLIEGKDQLGDMDIVFANDAGHHLIVEAKNHMLPLPVFFMDRMAVERRRDELRADWERKVVRRRDHLRREHARYGIGPDFTYLIVSRQPEFLAHKCPVLVLSDAEFRDWLALDPRPGDFASFYRRAYGDDPEFTPEQLEQMRARGLTVFNTEPPRRL